MQEYGQGQILKTCLKKTIFGKTQKTIFNNEVIVVWKNGKSLHTFLLGPDSMISGCGPFILCHNYSAFAAVVQKATTSGLQARLRSKNNFIFNTGQLFTGQ